MLEMLYPISTDCAEVVPSPFPCLPRTRGQSRDLADAKLPRSVEIEHLRKLGLVSPFGTCQVVGKCGSPETIPTDDSRRIEQR